MKETQKIFLNALNCVTGVGLETLKKVEEHLSGDFKSGFEASGSQLAAAGVGSPEISAIMEHRPKIDPEKEWVRLGKEKVRMIVHDEPGFPSLLKQIHSAPMLLYVKGELKKEDDFSFGIVGTRLATAYGKETAQTIAFKLASVGLTVVSGMAWGIDTEAHKGALSAKGRTVAVVASGLDEKSLFPQENVGLARKIIENGAVISEYPLGMKADREKFVARNRLISGLSRGVLIVEAPLRSGALITARHALDQNREVFAVPGNISSRMSFGTNLLIKQGAALVTRAEDILAELNLKFDFEFANSKTFKAANEMEKKIFEVLDGTGEPKHIDRITRESSLEVQNVNIALTALEMKGVVKSLGRGNYALEERYLTPIEEDEEV